MIRVEHKEVNQKLETRIRKVKLDKRLKPKGKNKDHKSKDPSPHTTKFLCHQRVKEGSREFSMLVEGAYIQELRVLVKLNTV